MAQASLRGSLALPPGVTSVPPSLALLSRRAEGRELRGRAVFSVPNEGASTGSVLTLLGDPTPHSGFGHRARTF